MSAEHQAMSTMQMVKNMLAHVKHIEEEEAAAASRKRRRNETSPAPSTRRCTSPCYDPTSPAHNDSDAPPPRSPRYSPTSPAYSDAYDAPPPPSPCYSPTPTIPTTPTDNSAACAETTEAQTGLGPLYVIWGCRATAQLLL